MVAEDGGAVGKLAADDDVVGGCNGDVGLSVGDVAMLELRGDLGGDFFEVGDAEGQSVEGCGHRRW